MKANILSICLGSPAPNILQEAPSSCLSATQCAKYLNPGMISDRHVCAYTGNTGACSVSKISRSKPPRTMKKVPY